MLALGPWLRTADIVKQRRQLGHERVDILGTGQNKGIVPDAIRVEPTMGDPSGVLQLITHPPLNCGQDRLLFEGHLSPKRPYPPANVIRPGCAIAP
jgi:hypothetical protein